MLLPNKILGSLLLVGGALGIGTNLAVTLNPDDPAIWGPLLAATLAAGYTLVGYLVMKTPD
jgi:hypothetical protein